MTLLRRSLAHLVLSSLLSIAACLIYNAVYCKAFELDFSSVLNASGIIGANVFAALLMGTAYYLLERFNKQKLQGWLNLFIALLSFASIVGVFGMQLPLTIESPELFPGLAVPMHFFPALAFFSVAPFFVSKQSNKSQ